ncbi:hypothetical protein CUMW_254050 [Citrus unshiu]|uniref:NB-ARC domain-containing protein n=1 Tax=Citrus unshiu TaxID=55188 RepID=A0A2H5QR88_CITUN|nr:hypothetical protein CUMW_254050 [Citrus unshiu]
MEEIICVDKLRDVSDISEIIGSEHNFFTQLESLGILYGPDLKSIYPNPLHFPKLKKIGVYGCPKLKKLPINSSSVKERRVVIEGLKEWWEELQWEDQATQNAFSSVFLLPGCFIGIRAANWHCKKMAEGTRAHDQRRLEELVHQLQEASNQ